jgi:hypothetical protein
LICLNQGELRLEKSKTPYVENGVKRILANRNLEERVSRDEPMVLFGGYELSIRAIEGSKAYVELSKDGQVVDSKVIYPSKIGATEADKTYTYSLSGLVTIAVHFKDATQDYLALDSRWQISDDTLYG